MYIQVHPLIFNKGDIMSSDFDLYNVDSFNVKGGRFRRSLFMAFLRLSLESKVSVT